MEIGYKWHNASSQAVIVYLGRQEKTEEKKQTILEMINNINKKSPKFAKQKKKQQTTKKYKKSLKSYAKVYASIKRKIKGKSKKVQNIQNGLKKS